MAGMPQKTLNWLYDVLKREYRDLNRTYSDLAQTLAQYPSLAPRTDVYTSEHGVPALLLNLKGTLPVTFRGTVYRFPIAVWIPHAYPYEAPIVYVTPTDGMVVRPGQHVSASDGKVYHHYLAQWKETWDRSNVMEFLRVLADIFAREPPVMAKPQQVPSQPQQQRQGGPPPVPFPPQDQKRYSSQPQGPSPPSRSGSSSQGGPPPPPPKQTADGPRSNPAGASSPAPRPGRYDAPPPLPHQAQPAARPPPQQPYSNGSLQQPAGSMQYMPQRTSSLRQEYPRQQPPLPQQHQPQSPNRPHPDQRSLPPQPPPNYSKSASIVQPTASNYSQLHSPPPTGPTGPPPTQPPAWQPHHPREAPPPFAQASHPQQPQQQQQTQNPHRHHQPQPPPFQPTATGPPHLQAQAQTQPPPQPKPTQPKDLLTADDPFQISLQPNTSTANNRAHLPAPPIPTNPEKTALLSHLSHLLLQHLHTTIHQTQTTALPSLASQHAALTTASQTLTGELHALQNLSRQLQSNIAALQSTLSSAGATIQSTQDPQHASHPDNMPAVDQVIIPPTVVARQLYDAVAEQKGYEAAIFALNEAFVRGRIGAEVWGRKVRECAREEMRRKWLVRKIGEGLALEEH